MKWYRKAADQGISTAQYYLGFCYESGRTVKRDLKEAKEWYRKAAEQDFDMAIIALERLEEFESLANPDAP